MVLAVLAAAIGFTATADEWKIDGEFKKVSAAKFPSQWIKNTPMFKNATAVMVPGKEAKENAVKIESKSGTPTVFSAHLIPVKIGDKLEIEFEAKGKGKANVGVYLYGKSFVASASATVAVDSPNKFTKYKTCVTLKKTPKPYTNARAIFGLIGAGSVTFTDIEVETEK